MTAFTGHVPAPERVSIETTRFCNLRCRMCLPFLAGSTVRGPHMDMEKFAEMGERFFPFVDYWQPTVSGEATVSPHFVEMVELAGRYGVKVDMVTNGTRLDEERIVRIAPHLARVYISFDSHDPEIFEAIREGAKFERVANCVRQIVRICGELLPADEMPVIGINCTLMEQNVRGLPDLIDFAALDLGVKLVIVGHLYPESEEMKAQSLAHHVELARTNIDEALVRAERHGVKLYVQALDQLTASTALSGYDREVPVQDGVVEGLELREWGTGDAYDLPVIQPTEDMVKLRSEALTTSTYPVPAVPPKKLKTKGKAASEVWWCDFLWKRSYIDITGDVRACCVPSAPLVGNVKVEPFDQIWNGENYQALRRQLVAKDPVSACKGCQHIKIATDPAEIHDVLQGMANPAVATVETDVPAAMVTPAVGNWCGWLESGEQVERTELRVTIEDGRAVARVSMPTRGRGWTDVTHIRLDGFALEFEVAVGSTRMSFKGLVESHWNALEVHTTDEDGRVSTLRMGRIPAFDAMGELESWTGEFVGEGVGDKFTLRLGAQFFGERYGWVDWQSGGLEDVPVDSWELEEGTLKLVFRTGAKAICLEAELSPKGDRMTGTFQCDGEEARAIELLRRPS